MDPLPPTLSALSSFHHFIIPPFPERDSLLPTSRNTGNRCCCSLSSGFSPSRFTLLTLLSLHSIHPPLSWARMSWVHLSTHLSPDWRKGGEEREEEMTDERKREEQPKSSDETSLSVKNDALLPETINWIFLCAMCLECRKRCNTLVLAYLPWSSLSSDGSPASADINC